MQNNAQRRLTGGSHFLITIGIFLVFIALFFGISEFLTSTIFDVRLSDLKKIPAEDFTRDQANALKFSQIFTTLGFVFSAITCAILFKSNFIKFTNLNRPPAPLSIVLAIGFFFGLMPLIGLLIEFNASFSYPTELVELFSTLEKANDNLYAAILKYNTGTNFIVNILIMSILPAIGEEIFFRGILLRVLTNWTKNVHLGILVTSVVFALLHFQPYKFIPMVVMAVIFGYIYYRTGSLWVPIILHALNNFMVVLGDWILKTQDSDPGVLSPDYEFTVGPMIIGLVVALGAGYLLLHQRKKVDFSYE
ncbi:MAG: CPBP family intramembrane metalloprotease [Bacteroidia bacterium]|nr:CPBP family intramembrane metalloprotease [Bacteroidia bacterium]